MKDALGLDWKIYDREKLNNFLNQTIKSSDDFAVWNVCCMFNTNEGEQFVDNAIRYLELRGWEPDGPLGLKRKATTKP